MAYTDHVTRKSSETPGLFQSAASAIDSLKTEPVKDNGVTLTINNTTPNRGKAMAVLIGLSYQLAMQGDADMPQNPRYDQINRSYRVTLPLMRGTKEFPAEQVKAALKKMQQQLMEPLIVNLEEVRMQDPPARFFAIPCKDKNMAELTLGALVALGIGHGYDSSFFGIGKHIFSGDGKEHPCALIKPAAKQAIIQGESLTKERRQGV